MTAVRPAGRGRRRAAGPGRERHRQPALPGRARSGAGRPDRDPPPGRRRPRRAARGPRTAAGWCWSRRSATTRPAPTVRALLEPHVTVVPLPLDGPLPDKARFRAGGQTLLRADGPGRPAGPCLPGGRRGDRVGGHAPGLRLRPGRGLRPQDPRRPGRARGPRAAGLGSASPRAGAGARHPAGHPQPRRSPGGRRPEPRARQAAYRRTSPRLRPGAPLRRRGRGPTAQPVAGGRRGRDPGTSTAHCSPRAARPL